MGKKAKRQNHMLKDASGPSCAVNSSPTARNLPKKDLGGVIFACKRHTMGECLSKELFGLPMAHFQYVKKIDPGLPLFLFNCTDRKLHGIFEAASKGQMHIDKRAWMEDKDASMEERLELSPFPAQVKVQTQMNCHPLLEDDFQPLIASNYYDPKRFWFELDRDQTNKLMDLFSTRSVSATTSSAKNPNQWLNLERSLLSSNSKSYCERTEVPSTKLDATHPDQASGDWTFQEEASSSNKGRLLVGSELSEIANHKSDEVDKNSKRGPTYSSGSTFLQKSWSSLFKSNSTSEAIASEVRGFEDQWLSDGMLEGENDKVLAENVEAAQLDHADEEWKSEKINVACGESLPLETQLSDNVAQEYVEVADLEENHERNYPRDVNLPCPPPASDAQEETDDTEVVSLDLSCEDADKSRRSKENAASNSSSPCISMAITRVEDNPGEVPEVPTDDVGVFAKLVWEVQEMKVSQSEQAHKISSLEHELAEARNKICCLEDRCKALELGEISAFRLVPDSDCRAGLEHHLGIDESIFIAGGYDGSSYLSASFIYSLRRDLLNSVCPMNFVRTQASVAKLRGELYVLGGIHGHAWHDTVESYSLESGKWTMQCSLNHLRGSVAGVSLKDTIFAIGGENGGKSFSDVEMYDPAVGRWIPTCSMLHKRSAPAAAELNGVLYAIGGYEEGHYFDSGERFDLRAGSWIPLSNMSTKRASHSLVVLNEKLYALGGYDGSRMVATIEVFEPRTGSWIMGEPMHESKGFHGAVVIGEAIYTLGGLGENNEILETVECYREDHGWQRTGLTAFGKRCSFSAIAI